jgi:hypothetical protein
MKLEMKIVDGIGTATRRVRLVLLLCPCLLFAGAGFAQTNVADATRAMAPAQYQRAMIGSAPSLPAAKTTESKAAPAGATARGPHEGIQVHGYWTIEVRNPDGTVTAHREFENAVQPDGEIQLAQILRGFEPSGGLSIALNGANMTFPDQADAAFNQTVGGYLVRAFYPNFNDAGPCLPITGYTGGPAGGTTCVITSVNNPAIETGTFLASIISYTNQSGSLGNSTNLVSKLAYPPILSATPPPLVLSGSLTVPATISAATINDVETLLTYCDSFESPTQCENNFSLSSVASAFTSLSNNQGSRVSLFTEKLLDSQNGDPAPVPYKPGQTIAVTVTISFQ